MNDFPECERLTGRLKAHCRKETGISLEAVNAYRRGHGVPELNEDGSLKIGPSIGRKLTFTQKVASLGKTLSSSLSQLVTTGKATADQSVIDARLAICKSCPEFTGTNCKLCDCSCTGKKTLKNKLAHASSVCPADIPRWGPLTLVGKPIDRSRLQSHILYHVMPLKGATEWVWRRHLDWLRQVRGEFNGRLILGVVTPGKNDLYEYFSPDDVAEAVAGLGAEIITAPNDSRGSGYGRKGLGEGVLFPKMLERLKTSDPDHIAFYGHCKGVTRPGPVTDVPHRWAVAMFDVLFRDHESAVSALDDRGICGPFLMPGGYADGLPGLGNAWFFSGTFFAMRLADVFSRNWRVLPQHYGCVEQFPRCLFDRDTEAKCLFLDNTHNLYDEEYWGKVVQPALNQRLLDLA